jgi:hypothetical protein
MENGDHEWQQSLKYNRYLGGNNSSSITINAGEKMVEHCLRGAHQGHPDCQEAVYGWNKDGFYYRKNGIIKHTFVKQDEKNAEAWLAVYNLNPRNYKHNQTVGQVTQETNTTQLELELQRAKVRQLELELQQAQMHPQNNTQADHHQSGFERDLKKADRVIKTTTHGVDLFNSLQNTGFF